MDAGIDADVPAFSTVMACSTSMMGAIEAAGMIDGDELQPRAGGRRRQPEPRPDRAGPAPVRLAAQVPAGALARPEARPRHARAAQATSGCYIPAIANRTTGLSMGEHTEITAKEWQIGRAEQDEIALQSHQRAVAGWDKGFFDDLVIPVGERQARHHSAQGHVAGEARAAAAVVRPHQRQGHADRRQLLAADRRRGGDLGRLVEGPGAAAADDAAGEARRLGDRARSTSASRAC